MPPKKNTEEITVEAELTVSSSKGVEIIRTFDKAWHRGLELPIPVLISFNRWVRKDK
jgi:hypothetical protein